jgi:hypothetical protein
METQTNTLNTPVLFLIFNREDTSRRVFEQIRAAKPKKLYVAADGARKNKEGEAEKCEATRAIIKDVDWDCEVKTLFRDENLGCKRAVSSAITWFFENEEMGMILEDDCLPNMSYFKFCQEMLEKYKDNDRVMIVSGDNFQNGQKRGKGSYYFTQFYHIWGWATWKRAWNKYDINGSDYSEFLNQNTIADIFPGDDQLHAFWIDKFNRVFKDNLDTWDYQWVYTILKNDGLGIAPNYNLISNIGFRPDATHTQNLEDRAANMPTEEMPEIVHPYFPVVNREADLYSRNNVFYVPTNYQKRGVLYKIARKIKRSIW